MFLVNHLPGKLRLQLKQYAEAEQVYKELLDINPENTTYYTRLAEAERHSSPSETLHMLQRYEELFPRALAPRRLQLNYATNDEFKVLVDRYLRKGNFSFYRETSFYMQLFIYRDLYNFIVFNWINLFLGLHKGVPPLFVNLRSLYTDKEKVEIISSLLVQYKEALKLHGHFSDQEKDNPREPASALLWTYYYLAQHYDYLGQTEKALIEIDAAIDHTPTLIELFVTKGRIYKVGYLT